MTPFDPGGGAPHALADGQPMASSGEFGSAQLCARINSFCPRGLKEGIFFEDAQKRVLHSTYRATLYLTARNAPASPLPDPSNNAHVPSVPKNSELFIDSRRNIKASDKSICFPENVAGSTEGQRLTPVDCSTRVHDKVKRIMGSGNVQQEQQNTSHVSTSFDDSMMLSNHPGASLLCVSKSLQNNCRSASSNFTSLQALHIPRALALHVSCDEMRQASEFCKEDPDAPSTPDLQPEVRSWDCEALCTKSADQMRPADNLCPTGSNDLVSADNPCNKDADDMLPAHKFLSKDEGIISTSIVQCPAGPKKCLPALMKQEEDTCKDYNSLSDPSYKCSSSFLRESANSRKGSRKLDSRACRQYILQRLFYCLMISDRSICGTPNTKKSHSQFSLTLQSLPGLIRFLRWEGLNCEGEVIFEQLLAAIQISLQVCKPRLIPDHDEKAMEASWAACYSKQLAHKQVHLMAKEYAGRNGHHQRVDMKMIVQEQVLIMLQVFLQRYLARRSGIRFWLRCLYLEQDIVGKCELHQCSSTLSSKVCIVSASSSPNLLKSENGRSPRSTEPSSEMMHDFEENFAESHGSSSWSQEKSSIRIVEEVDDWNSIEIEQVGECLDTCRLHLQARPSAFPSDLTKILDLSVIRNQSEDLNIKCSNGSIIDEGEKDYIVCARDNRHEASYLPTSSVDGPCSLTLSQCSSSLDFSMEESKSCMPHGGVYERQSREKLKHFAEVFLLRRHIIQQQRRAQQAPPYPCRESAADGKCSASTGLIAGGKPSPYYTYSSTNASMKSLENRNHEPTMILTSSSTKPCDVTSSFCDNDRFVGTDIVIDIVGLVKYLETTHSSQLETFTDAAANSIGYTHHMPFMGGQLDIPNVNAVIVTIVAIMVYTKILLEGALAWVGSRTQSKEEK